MSDPKSWPWGAIVSVTTAFVIIVALSGSYRRQVDDNTAKIEDIEPRLREVETSCDTTGAILRRLEENQKEILRELKE